MGGSLARLRRVEMGCYMDGKQRALGALGVFACVRFRLGADALASRSNEQKRCRRHGPGHAGHALLFGNRQFAVCFHFGDQRRAGRRRADQFAGEQCHQYDFIARGAGDFLGHESGAGCQIKKEKSRQHGT